MQVGKLNPQTPPVASASSTSTWGKLNFPGFQEILDFTSAGSEASVSVTVDGDTDKEYKIFARAAGSNYIVLRINANTTNTNYGTQYIETAAGTLAASRTTAVGFWYFAYPLGVSEATLLTPVGLQKTLHLNLSSYTSGTTMNTAHIEGCTYIQTANVTSLDFAMNTGNFTSGTRITVYARRSNV